MTNGLLGKKLGMTQVFDQNRLTPVTVIAAGPCRVVAVKTKERDGYEAVQLSFGEVKERKLSKAELGHLKKNQATKRSSGTSCRSTSPPLTSLRKKTLKVKAKLAID